MLKYITQGALLLWMSYVMYYYFQFHQEYKQAYDASPRLFSSFLITFIVIYGCYFLYQNYFNDKDKIKIKKSPLKMILIGLFGVFLIASIFYTKTGVAKAGIGYFFVIKSVFSKLLPVILTQGGTFLLSFLLGDTLSKLLGIKWPEMKKGIVNIAFGLSSILLILFLMGWAHMLTKPYIYGAIVFLFLICFRSYGDLYDWLTAKNKEEEEIKFFSMDTFLYIVLFFFISINCFDVMRPMPIGWDDMGVYLNMPQRIAEDGAVLSGMASQGYMLLSSLGFILWPKYIGDMVGMYFSWFGGLLGVVTIFVFVRRFFNERMALFAAVYYYLMPMITFQSALDLKMDPPLFFFMASAGLVLFDQSHSILTKVHDTTYRISREEMIKWGIGGLILATAFFIKITTSMEMFAFIALVTFYVFNWKTAAGVILLECALFLVGFANIPEFSPELSKTLGGIFAISGVIILGLSGIKKYQIIHLKDITIATAMGFLVVAMPWFIFNYNDARTLSFNALTGGKFHEEPKIDLKSIGIDEKGKDKMYCENTATREELGRYIGYNQPFMQKYFTLPWKNTMNTETRGYYLDIGFLYLAVIPGLFLLGLWRKWGKKEWGIIVLFCVNWFFWAFSAMGVPWYGLFGFLPAITMVGMFLYDDDLNKSYMKYISLCLIFISFLSFCILRETKTGNGATIKYAFGLETAEKTVDSIVPTYRDTSKIVAGDVSQQEYSDLLKKYMLPFYEEQFKKQNMKEEESKTKLEEIKQSIDAFQIPKRDKNNPNYVYHIGTFIPYFIKDFRRVMSGDLQLDRFKCINGDGSDEKRTLERLKKLGFKYFIFDTNTATIERDPNGSLHQKVKAFVDFANKNLKIIYYKPDSGIALMML